MYYDILEYVLALVFGLSFGNLATSAVFRLPRNLPLNGIEEYGGKPPHCSVCKHPLAFKEYFPVFGTIFFLMNRKCSYCGTEISIEYFLVELLVGAVSIWIYAKFGFSEEYILLLGLAICLIILSFIQALHSETPSEIIWAILFFGAIYRVRADASIYPFLHSGMLAVFLGFTVLGLHKKHTKAKHFNFSYFKVLIAAGICVDIALWIQTAAVTLLASIALSVIWHFNEKRYKFPWGFALAAGLMTALLHPLPVGTDCRVH